MPTDTTTTTATSTSNTTTPSWRDVLPIHPAALLLPRMSEADLRALGEDIKAHGQRHPVKFFVASVEDDDDTQRQLLDGIHRLDGMETVGLEVVKDGKINGDVVSYEYVYGDDHSECGGDPYAFVISANLHRRHLTAEDKRDLIAKLLKATPEKSNRQIAETVKVSHVTVGAVRAELESTGQIDQLKKTVGKDGKARKQPDPRVKAAADRAEARSRENQRRQAAGGNGVDTQASAEQRKAEARAEPPTDDGFDALLAAWCAATDAAQERLMLTVGLTRSKPHLVGEAECLQRTAPSAPVDGDPMPPIPDALEFLRRGAP